MNSLLCLATSLELVFSSTTNSEIFNSNLLNKEYCMITEKMSKIINIPVSNIDRRIIYYSISIVPTDFACITEVIKYYSASKFSFMTF